MRIGRLVLSAMLIAALSGAAMAQEYRYAIINVGDPGGLGIAEARAINNDGVVAGSTADGASGDLRAYVWRDGSHYYLPLLIVDRDTFAYDISSDGDVIGFSRTESLTRHAVLWPLEGGVIDLDTLGGPESRAYGINSHGHIVGGADLATSGSNPFLWIDGEMTPLGDFGQPAGAAQAINERGQIIGYATGDPDGGAFLWEDGRMVNLGALVNSRRSFAQDINESELVVGYAEVLDSTTRAVIWRNRAIVNIHDSRLGVESFAFAVNEPDQVVGGVVVDDIPLEFAAFLYEGDGPMVKLDTLLPPRLEWVRIEAAFDINDHGEIVGYGDRSNGHGAAYLITPVHPTLTLQGPQPGTAGTLNGLRLTGCTPGERVHFYYSTTGGGTLVPGCSHTDGVTLQLENPIRIGSATANANGVATLTRFVPPQARNLGDVLIQAVQPESCRISQLVVHEFE